MAGIQKCYNDINKLNFNVDKLYSDILEKCSNWTKEQIVECINAYKLTILRAVQFYPTDLNMIYTGSFDMLNKGDK